jgi:hypothetical protein
VFDEATPPSVLARVIVFPLALDVLIGFEFGVGFDFHDAPPCKHLVDFIHQDRVHALALILGTYRHQVQIPAISLSQGTKQMDKPKGKKSPIGLLQCLGEGWHGNPKCN